MLGSATPSTGIPPEHRTLLALLRQLSDLQRRRFHDQPVTPHRHHLTPVRLVRTPSTRRNRARHLADVLTERRHSPPRRRALAKLLHGHAQPRQKHADRLNVSRRHPTTTSRSCGDSAESNVDAGYTTTMSLRG